MFDPVNPRRRLAMKETLFILLTLYRVFMDIDCSLTDEHQALQCYLQYCALCRNFIGL
jgi:hypothetical protein